MSLAGSVLTVVCLDVSLFVVLQFEMYYRPWMSAFLFFNRF